MANLTKLQKIIFMIMIVLIIGLAAGLILLLVSDKEDTKANETPTAIKEMEPEAAKDLLSEVYHDAELTRVYKETKIEDIQENMIFFLNQDGRELSYKLTDNTIIEKIDFGNSSGSVVQEGNRADLEKGSVLKTVKVNPIGEIEYVSYLAQ